MRCITHRDRPATHEFIYWVDAAGFPFCVGCVERLQAALARHGIAGTLRETDGWGK